MPNTIAHLGVGELLTRRLLPTADRKWIYLGSILPDLPWIARRIISALPTGIDPYDLRLYAVGQSSLLVTLLLAGALATISKAPRLVFAVLALNCLIHLLLDAAQTKWGNGVHLIAPISWKAWNFGLFWPESIITALLTLAGAVFYALAWRSREDRCVVTVPHRHRLATAAALGAAYLMLPLFFLASVEQENNLNVRTLRDPNNRTGRSIQLDRVRYFARDDGDRLRTYVGEELAVEQSVLGHDATVSVHAIFVDSGTVRINRLHEHFGQWRDVASIVGLIAVVLYWCRPWLGFFRVVRTRE